MSIENGKESIRGPISFSWAIQADVLDAMLGALKNGTARTAEDLVVIIVENDILKPKLSNVRAAFKTRYETDGQLLGDKVWDELNRQREWLAKYNDIPPVGGHGMSQPAYRIIKEHYQRRAQGI